MSPRLRRILFVIIAVAIIAVATPLAFWLAGNAAGFIIIFLWVGVIGWILYRSGREPPLVKVSEDSAAPRGPGEEDQFRLLIAASAAASGPGQIPPDARRLIESADAVRVISPVLPTRLDWLASATDDAEAEADERLQTVLGHLDEMGAEPSGSVAADDPLLAFEDAIRDFRPDHLLVALRGEGEADWQERGLPDSLDERFGIPMTVFELSD